MKYLIIALLAFSSVGLSQQKMMGAISKQHQDLGIKRVGYGYKLDLSKKRPKFDVYKIDFESNDEKALASVHDIFKPASMSESQIEDKLHKLEIAANKARRAFSDEKDPSKKEELKKVMDKANHDRNYWNNSIWYTAQLGPIYHRIKGPDKQLANVLEEFWSNHFNVSRKSQRFLIGYRRMIRENIDKSFYDLLLNSAKHPAMTNYLDLRTSRKGRINENYAREVLELHTFGDEEFKHYDQKDIVAVANILTGWAWERKEVEGLSTIQFAFLEGHNEPAAQQVFQAPHTFATEEGASLEKGEALLKHLANHPATKANICKKIHYWFIGGYDEAAIAKCLEAWGVNGNLKAIYTAMFDVQDIHRNYETKDRNPFELVIARERLTQQELSFDYLKKLSYEMDSLGLKYADIAPPTGYKDRNKLNNGAKLVTWIRGSVEKLAPSPEISAHLMQNYGKERGFAPPWRYVKAIGDKTLVTKKQLRDSMYQPFIDRKSLKADVYATFTFKTITSPAFMRK